MRRIWAVLCFTLGSCVLTCTGGDYGSAESYFRTDANLVLVHATVVDQSDKFVTNLTEKNFRLFDGKDERKIISIALEDAPVSVGIVFDASGSMKRAQRFAIEALREFLHTADPRDDYCVVQVRDRPELTLDFTPDADQVLKQLAAAPPIGSTALIDAVYLTVQHMKHAPHTRRMLLVITDGDDNSSRYSLRELKGMLEESNVTVYPIGVGVRSASFFDAGLSAVQVLTQMAETTGGRYLEAQYAEDLPDIMRKIDIRYQYVLGFAPQPGDADGRYHRLQLKVVAPGRLKAFWRPGYYAPDLSAQARRESPRARRQDILKPEPAGDAEPRD